MKLMQYILLYVCIYDNNLPVLWIPGSSTVCLCSIMSNNPLVKKIFMSMNENLKFIHSIEITL